MHLTLGSGSAPVIRAGSTRLTTTAVVLAEAGFSANVLTRGPADIRSKSAWPMPASAALTTETCVADGRFLPVAAPPPTTSVRHRSLRNDIGATPMLTVQRPQR